MASNVPKSAPTVWTVDDLKQHLQTAMRVEAFTIPLYLFAAYSIKDNALATYKILSTFVDRKTFSYLTVVLAVVRQEMLHLALAGNTLCAIGGKPKVYGTGYTPSYPAKMFYEGIELKLMPAIKNTILTFRRVGLI